MLTAAMRQAAKQSDREELERKKQLSAIRLQQDNDARRAAIWGRILALETEERRALYSTFMNARPDLSTYSKEVRDEFISSGIVRRPTVRMALIAFAASHL